jgi:hypothetical protein
MRERDIADLGERERTEMRRENGVGGKRGQCWFDFEQWSKSTYGYFWILQIV